MSMGSRSRLAKREVNKMTLVSAESLTPVVGLVETRSRAQSMVHPMSRIYA